MVPAIATPGRSGRWDKLVGSCPQITPASPFLAFVPLCKLHLFRHPLTEERTFQQTFELTKPKPKPKPRKAPEPKPRKPKARKPRVPTKTVEERIESRREYDRTRRQTDDRKEFQRLYKQQVRHECKAAGLCRNCSNKAITGQTRCEVCRDKHRASR